MLCLPSTSVKICKMFLIFSLAESSRSVAIYQVLESCSCLDLLWHTLRDNNEDVATQTLKVIQKAAQRNSVSPILHAAMETQVNSILFINLPKSEKKVHYLTIKSLTDKNILSLYQFHINFTKQLSSLLNPDIETIYMYMYWTGDP